MRQIVRIALLSCAATLICLIAPFAAAQSVSIPAQIVSAKTAFISNGGSTAPALSANDLYVGFYSAMKSWGKYELRNTPASADLVFMISYAEPPSDTSNGTSFRKPQLTLVILDPKTQVTLWTITEFAQPNPHKAADRTFENLIDQVKRLQGDHSPAAPAAKAAPEEPPQKEKSPKHIW
jgi:hypothetical protein